MPAVLVPLSFSCLLVHVVSRLTLMSLRRMSCIPHLVHVSRHLFKFPFFLSQLYDHVYY